MTENKKVEIGNIYNIGIGNGGSADCEVVRIEKDSTNGDQAVLEMIKYGGPLQKWPVSYLQEKGAVSENTKNDQEQARREFLQSFENDDIEEALSNDSKKNKVKVLDFFHSTIGLQVSHENLKRDKLVRVDFHKTDDENKIALLTVSGQNLSRISAIKTTYVSKEEYEAKPHDPYNDSITAIWALNKCGCSV